MDDKCIVKGCANHKHEGRFVGDLCAPCHSFITTGAGVYSQAYRNALNTNQEWTSLNDDQIQDMWWEIIKDKKNGPIGAIYILAKEIDFKLKEMNG